jgi:hypothetical protein
MKLSDHDRVAWLTLLLLFCGVVLRVLAAYPSHKYAADADCAMNGLCAFKVLHGSHPVFFSGVRIGSLGAHLTALLFLLFGVNRDSFAAGSVIVGVLTLFAWYLFLREVLGRKLALAGLPFAAVLPPAVGFWTYQPNGYPEIFLFCATTLWLAARSARGEASTSTLFGLGLSAGLGWWQSLQTLQCTLPALLWLHWRSPGLWRRRGVALAVAAGFLAGAFPWIEFNLHHLGGSFRSNYGTRPASSAAAVLDNTRYLIAADLPELVASTDPENAPDPVPAFRLWLRRLTLVVCSAAAVFFSVSQAMAAWQARRAPGGAASPPLVPAAVLFALVAVTVAVTTVISEPGGFRGLTVRYILPLYLLVPGLLAVLFERLGRRWLPLTLALGSAIVVFYLAGANLPGAARRQKWAAWKSSDERLLMHLRRDRIEAVAGSFWIVYPLGVLSDESVKVFAFYADPYGLDELLGSRPLRWAFIGHDESGLLKWSQRAQLAGSVERVDDLYSLFLPRPNPPLGPTPALLERLEIAARDMQHQLR